MLARLGRFSRGQQRNPCYHGFRYARFLQGVSNPTGGGKNQLFFFAVVPCSVGAEAVNVRARAGAYVQMYEGIIDPETSNTNAPKPLKDFRFWVCDLGY